MTELEFKKIWHELYDWYNISKEIYTLGVDLSKYDAKLYNIIISLLKYIYNAPQVDLIIFSIFSETKNIEIENKSIIINNADICWEYLNKID